MFIGCYNRTVILTYIGICFGVIGIMNVENLALANICLILAGICDMFDGKIARLCKRTEQEKKFGIQIDSLCDTVLFLVFPVIILHQIFVSSNETFKLCGNYEMKIVEIISVLYILAGVTRLGWFNITTDGETKFYQGLPVTSIAAILPVAYLILTRTGISCLKLYILGIFIVVEFLFVANIKIKKLKGLWYAIFLFLGIVLSALFFKRLIK